MPAGAGNPPNIKMEPPKSNFNITEGGGAFNTRGKGLKAIQCFWVRGLDHSGYRADKW